MEKMVSTTVRSEGVEQFETSEMYEAALMLMRTGREPRCRWDRRHYCTFIFDGCTKEDINFANGDSLVKARDFNRALYDMKSIMYASDKRNAR